MTNQTASLEYRRAATQHASVVGLVIALHDTLVGDIRRAAEAIERNDIQGRCDQLIHAFKILQQLESMLDMENGGQAAINIKRFYAHVRGQLMLAQFKLSSAILYKQIEIVLDVRGAWQQVDSAAAQFRQAPVPAGDAMQAADDPAVAAEPRLSFSCSF